MNHTKIMAITIMGLMVVSGMALFLPAHLEKNIPLIAHSMTKTGDAYNGSKVGWHWYVYAPTVYDGSSERVYANITIVSGGLTFKNGGVLKMDMATQYQYEIYVTAGAYFKMENALLTTTNTSAGIPQFHITAEPGANIFLSNSTIEHVDVLPNGSGDYIDNCTMHSSKIDAPVGNPFQTRMNISSNTFDHLTAGQAITGGFAKNTNITGNTIDATCVQTYAAGAAGWINVLGPYSGQTRGTHIMNNHIIATVHYLGIYLIDPEKVRVSGNIIDLVARNANGVSLAGLNAGIFLRGEGLWSSIDNNTIKHVTGYPLLGGYSGFNIGIASFIDAIHWNILYNKIWHVGSAENNSCLGIDYEGSHANIKGNNFTFVGLDQGPAYINTAGIIVENNFMGVYTQPTYYNSLNCEYVNTTYNVVVKAQAASNAITYGWALAGHNVTKGIIAYNTIGTTYAGSGGIGVYIHASHIQVLYNTITAVHHDSYGIGTAADVKYITVSHNSIHVVSENLANYGGDYYGEGISNWSEGAIMAGSETYMDSLEGNVYSYNHIVVDSRSNAPYPLPYNDYVIHYCGEANPKPIFIVTEAAHFAFINSTLEIRATLSGLPAQFTLNGDPATFNQTPHQSTWYSNTPIRSWSFLNVTQGDYKSSLQPVHQWVVLIIVFFALTVALMVVGVATQSKDKGMDKDELIKMVIGVVVSLVALGILITIIGS